MAIVKVGTYRNPPEDITDYEAIVAHLEAYTRQIGNQGMILTEWTNTTNAPKIAMGSYISHGGVLYVVEDEDYALPALSVDGTYYIRVAVSGETLAVTLISDLTGYAWNAIYNGLYHADGGQVLGYQIVLNAGAYKKYRMLDPHYIDKFTVVDYLGNLYVGNNLSVTGAISGESATVNEVSVSTKAVLRGREMTYGFNGVTRREKEIDVASSSFRLSSIAWDGTYFYIFANGIIKRLNSEFNPIDSIDPPNLSGMTWIDGKLITCYFSTIYVYDGFSTSLITSFPAPGDRCCGLGSKNGNLVSIDYATRTIYEHVGITESFNAFPIQDALASIHNSYNLVGVCWTGENYIVAVGEYSIGSKWAELYSLSKDMTTIHDAISLESFGLSGKIAGLTIRGTRIYTCGTETVAPNYVYQIPMRLKP